MINIGGQMTTTAQALQRERERQLQLSQSQSVVVLRICTALHRNDEINVI